MARPLRIQYENAYYHVTCRGNAREDIFRDDADRENFLDLLARSGEIYQVDLLAFALMANHFHLIIRTPMANLQEFMRHFNISYTSYFNYAHDRVGHLYQGRYKSFLIDADSYLMEVSRYVHLNPVRVKTDASLPAEELRKALRGYRWSSYPGYIRKNDRYPWLSREDLLACFGGDDSKGRRAYAQFVESGLAGDITNPLARGKGHGIIGDEAFMAKITDRFFNPQSKRELPAVKKIEKRVNPARILDAVAAATGTPQTIFFARRYTGVARGLAMELLYRHGGLTQREIGDLIGMDYSTVSVVRKRFRLMRDQDHALKALVDKVQKRYLGK
jgi:putative transposase